jgi:drug/metabolite transporter (DMT)-like permease
MNSSALFRTIVYTLLALIAFAANSLLCRMALKQQVIDPASFTSIRLVSGAVVLLFLVNFSGNKGKQSSKGSWGSALMLFLYAAAFSFAYTSLDTGTGALILFASVQLTMISYALYSGKRMSSKEWLGVGITLIGFVYLVLPGVTAPALHGLALMSLSGIAWGIYSLRGKGSEHALQDTAYNFLRTIPLIVVLVLLSQNLTVSDPRGIVLAMISGGITSGIGYTIWYMALRGLSAVQASVVQLAVPVIAALGGVIWLSESITGRLLLSALLILGGIFLLFVGRND